MSYIERNNNVIDKFVDDISDDIIKTSRRILRTEDINFTGGLSDKISKHKSGEFKYIVYDSPYAELVEDGMPPGGNVDIVKLREWVRKKLGITDERGLGVATGNIYNKIINKGIEPTRFLDKSLDYIIKLWGKKSRHSAPSRISTKNITRKVNKIQI